MAWTGEAGPNNKIVTMSASFPTLASAALSGVELGQWPFAFKGRLVAITVGADARSVASDVLARFRRFDSSASATAFVDTAGASIPAGSFTLVDRDTSTTVEAEEIFEVGDRLIFDKNAGGSITRGQVQAHFAIGG